MQCATQSTIQTQKSWETERRNTRNTGRPQKQINSTCCVTLSARDAIYGPTNTSKRNRHMERPERQENNVGTEIMGRRTEEHQEHGNNIEADQQYGVSIPMLSSSTKELGEQSLLLLLL